MGHHASDINIVKYEPEKVHHTMSFSGIVLEQKNSVLLLLKKRALRIAGKASLFTGVCKSELAACSKPLSNLSAAELLDLGEKYLIEMNYEQALVQFLKVIEVEPMNPRGYTGAADSYVGLEQPVESINVVRSGIQTINEIEKSEPLFVWLEDFGDLMFAEDNFDLSALAYEAIVAENPRAEYAYKLAQVYIASGDIDKAIELLRRIADLLNDEDLRWEADRLEQLSNDGSAVGLIRIIGVSPQSALWLSKT